ncbi:MAG TPA: hypothetical protein VK894_06890, partial [Jiangellales bacterium]|nr:hypothetical protein [Jiangellales bacterium]
ATVLIAISEALLGRFDHAWGAADEAESLLTTPQRPLDVSGVHFARGVIHLERGAVADAVPDLAAAHDLCVGIGVVMVAQWSQPRLGEALARCGRAAEAREHLAAAMQQATVRDAPLWRAWTLTGLCHLELAEGRPDRAAAHADELAALADERGYPHAGAVADRLAAQASLAMGDLPGAEARARSAAARAAAAGARPELARAELQLSAVLELTGRHDEAGATAGRARAIAESTGLFLPAR